MYLHVLHALKGLFMITKLKYLHIVAKDMKKVSKHSSSHAFCKESSEAICFII